jgi:hypothetical protein
MKESELKMDRQNRQIQKSELDINRFYRAIQSEDRIGIGRSIIQTFRPPLVLTHPDPAAEVNFAVDAVNTHIGAVYNSGALAAYGDPWQFLARSRMQPS